MGWDAGFLVVSSLERASGRRRRGVRVTCADVSGRWSGGEPVVGAALERPRAPRGYSGASAWAERLQERNRRVAALGPSGAAVAEIVHEIVQHEPAEQPGAALRALKSARGDQVVLRAVFEEMKRQGCPVNTVVYNYVISCFGGSEGLKTANQYFNEMVEEQITPDSVTYNTLLTANAREKRMGRVLELYREMVLFGVSTTPVTNATVVDAYVRTGNLEGARKTLQHFENSGEKLNAVAWSSLMNGYAKKGKLEEVERTFGEMVASGCVPTSISYAIHMTSLVRGGKIERARDVLDVDMAEAGVTPTADNYNVLLAAYARDRDLDSALQLFESMAQSGAEPDTYTFNTLVNAAARAGHLEKGREMLREMESRGLKPDVVAFRTLLKGYGRAQDCDKEMELLDELAARGMDVDLKMMTSMIHTRLAMGQVGTAVDMFWALPHLNLSPDAFLCNKMLCGMAKARSAAEALTLYEHMRAHRLPTNEHTNKILMRLRTQLRARDN